MKKWTGLAIVLLFSIRLWAQHYQADWSSLDQRPVPQWFKDAKFGIFIHWGVYSVPGWSSKGSYAEWYQYGLQTNDSARMRYHRMKFGNLTYYQLVNQFKAELFDPQEWAKLFDSSGARYIVLTSKHHDGFCLWPSAEADKTWGFPWNAAEVGPQRDLLGDLFKAVRKTKVRAGMYYSLYEWFNPLWKANHQQFAVEHTWPQMKDLINKYQPDVFWTDGDWDAPAETWKSQDFLAWLYNESPVKDKVVVNDRWGSGIRFKHAGIYTPEYQPDLDFDNHYWEESRGMGFSYGYNRAEDAWDYNSAQSLVLQLVDKVSRGGNFLLDIGPDAHGKIPPIMQERLLLMGQWLAINGEAIYNTVRWQRSSQWSEGRTDYKPRNGDGDLLLKLTVDPEPGYAVKEIFYTYNPNQNTLYAIMPRYPSNRSVLLKDMEWPAGTNVYLLSTGQKLAWKQEGRDTRVNFPEYDPNKIKSPYAFVMKIENFGRFTRKPEIKIEYAKGTLRPMLQMEGPPGAVLHYSVDASDPDIHSPVYQSPLPLNPGSTIKARAFGANALPSLVVQANSSIYEWQKPLRVTRAKKGLLYAAYELAARTVDDLATVNGSRNGIAIAIDPSWATRQENAGLRFEGYIKADESALYTFYLSSDDGSVLWIDGKKLVDNDGLHGSNEKSGTMALQKGYHSIRLDYFQATGGIDLKLEFSTPGKNRQVIPSNMLFHR